MGKGSQARPIPDRKTFESNWDAIFKKTEDSFKLCADCGQPIHKDLIHTCSPQVKENK